MADPLHLQLALTQMLLRVDPSILLLPAGSTLTLTHHTTPHHTTPHHTTPTTPLHSTPHHTTPLHYTPHHTTTHHTILLLPAGSTLTLTTYYLLLTTYYLLLATCYFYRSNSTSKSNAKVPHSRSYYKKIVMALMRRYEGCDWQPAHANACMPGKRYYYYLLLTLPSWYH